MKGLEQAILETRNLTKRFGDLVAVNDVNISIERGVCKGLIGPNGAGKTTFFNLICGIVKPTSGRVILKGRDITGFPKHKIAKRGIGRSYQITNVFSRLPVLENVRIAVQSRGKDNHNFYSDAKSLKEYEEGALEILETVGLKGKEFFIPSALTHGDMRKLEIGIALATKPELLLLDEPTAGVSIEEVPDVMNIIRRIKQTGAVTVLLVEHKIDVVMDVCDSILVMHEGSIIADGAPKEIADNKLVQRVYLGGD